MKIALMTGRGGSSFADKNLIKFNGIPCVAYGCIAANKTQAYDVAFCSSDDHDILSICSEYGFKSIKRPDYLASSTAKHVDVIEHFLDYLGEDKAKKVEILTVLMANTATVNAEEVMESIEALENDPKLTAAVPVTLNQDHHPLRARKLENGTLQCYFEPGDAVSSNRQDLPQNYFLTHSFWSIRLTEGKLPFSLKSSPWTFLGECVKPVVVKNSIDIHDRFDVLVTQELLDG